MSIPVDPELIYLRMFLTLPPTLGLYPEMIHGDSDSDISVKYIKPWKEARQDRPDHWLLPEFLNRKSTLHTPNSAR